MKYQVYIIDDKFDQREIMEAALKLIQRNIADANSGLCKMLVSEGIVFENIEILPHVHPPQLEGQYTEDDVDSLMCELDEQLAQNYKDLVFIMLIDYLLVHGRSDPVFRKFTDKFNERIGYDYSNVIPCSIQEDIFGLRNSDKTDDSLKRLKNRGISKRRFCYSGYSTDPDEDNAYDFKKLIERILEGVDKSWILQTD